MLCQQKFSFWIKSSIQQHYVQRALFIWIDDDMLGLNDAKFFENLLYMEKGPFSICAYYFIKDKRKIFFGSHFYFFLIFILDIVYFRNSWLLTIQTEQI